MHTFSVTSGKKILIDDDDINKINQYTWFIGKRGYVVTTVWDKEKKKRKQIKLHRLIMNPPINIDIDHIDRNPLNNQKSNLRFASVSLNLHNRGISKNNKSGYKGIFWDKLRKSWRVYITINKKTLFLGRYFNLEEAIGIRNKNEVMI